MAAGKKVAGYVESCAYENGHFCNFSDVMSYDDCELRGLSHYLTGGTEEEEGHVRYDIQACGQNLKQRNSEYGQKGSMDSWFGTTLWLVLTREAPCHGDV
jgi:hypothetical protein